MNLPNNVVSLDCTLKSHVYLVPDSKGYTLIDASFPGDGPAIINELKQMNIDLSKIHQILLTHSDWDHMGSLAYLCNELNVSAYCSKVELENWMQKGINYPFIPQELKPMLLETKKYVKPLEGNTIGDFEVIYCPYKFHSFGMCMYAKDGMLFAGDMIQSQKGEFMLIPQEFNLDENVYIDYLKNFDMSKYSYVCHAHGKPLPSDKWENLIKTL